ncbi:MAG: hypothetical protein QOJ35_2417 [Solirubrobacteraceae bacterium]|nr:hypothetical protein [Solirubrobacteraceae bacterium]
MPRIAMALSLAAILVACAAGPAEAFTLRLVFPDGRPMTYGSACNGTGCLDAGSDVRTTDAHGAIELGDGGPRTIEYRRDGIALAQAPVGVASGTLVAAGDGASVVLARLLVGSAPAVDAVESDLVAQINDARAAEGLPAAQINPRLSAAADLQATWLVQSGVAATEPDRFHDGPFDSTMAFRLGEVSFPQPERGREVVAAGGTPEQALSDWMGSPPHREQLLEPGQLLIGAGMVGSFVVVETHAPCAGCEQMGTGTRMGAVPPPAPQPAPPPPAAASPTTGSAAPRPSCGREQLHVRRLRERAGRVRVRVSTQCLRPGAGYVLIVRRGRTGPMLRTRRIVRAGTLTFRLRPAQAGHLLRIKLKRDGRAIVAQSLSLR